MVIAACASPASDTILNSDRIEQEFGNYDIEVLFASEQQRVSSLYSSAAGSRVTRTFAVVDFNSPMPVIIAEEHRHITSGGSIGEVFRNAGWQIDKQHIFIGELDVSAKYSRIGSLFGVSLPQPLAAHVYLFVISKDQRRLTYATITEIHHPHYLTVDELGEIYGEILFDDSNRNNLDDFVTLPDSY